MNHYCTSIDRGYLIQGLAFWHSLSAHDSNAVLWVLALDDLAADVLRETGDTSLHVIPLADVEAGDTALAAAKTNRMMIEYYFTLQPCWPRWLLLNRPEIDRLTALDADMAFFSSPGPVFKAMDAARASILITAHGFPPWLGHYERHGRFNAGFLSIRRDAAGLACLDDWRARCLDWCHDRIEGGKYSCQKYLDDWPVRFGAAVLVLAHSGVNLAPWNWAAHQWEIEPGDRTEIRIGGQPLVLFHYARFRPIFGTWWWQSGQLDYGVMPRRLRNAIYGPYWRALAAARTELNLRHPGLDFRRPTTRLGRNFARGLLLRSVFGSDWLRVGEVFYSGRFGLGRFSGRCLAWLRRTLRRNRPETTV
jgi:hypothetical protein